MLDCVGIPLVERITCSAPRTLDRWLITAARKAIARGQGQFAFCSYGQWRVYSCGGHYEKPVITRPLLEHPSQDAVVMWMMHKGIASRAEL